MSEEPIDPRTLPPEPVECSLGTWTHSDVDEHGNVYLITRPDGQVWGIRAKADLSAENLEDDIANPGTLPATVPQSVKPWQMRRAINAAGLRASVDAALAQAGRDTQDGWEVASEIRRDNPLIAGMATALGLTPTQVDALFIAAAAYQ